jgi:hypothetical protein
MRDPDPLARVERNGRFARVRRENGEIESICLRCFLTLVAHGGQTQSDAEWLHYDFCSKLLKPWD